MEGSPYLAWHEIRAFFTSGDTKRYKLRSCKNMCEALMFVCVVLRPSQQLRSCRAGQLPINTVPGQA